MRLFRMEHERKLAEEEQIKQNKELEVLNMEKLEMELIKKLQHTQMLQKAAYEELEVALAEEPQEYEKKYLNGEGEYDINQNSNPGSRGETPQGNQLGQNYSEKDIQGRPQGSKEELNASNDQKNGAHDEKKSEGKSRRDDDDEDKKQDTTH